ncbi:MAG TPA: proton-conducting transporter membrane subunit [Nannocystaceae bacterium]|nr:proton-conducting transporter membrane subunit [Nannocystaceae bacterium]
MTLFAVLVAAGVALPAILLLVLGGASLAARPLSEQVTGVLVRAVFTGVAAAFLVAAGLSLPREAERHVISFGSWFVAGEYSFELRLLADPLSLIFSTLCAVLIGVVAAFANRYLHREPGYNRFFVSLALFALGILLIVLAGSIEVVFAGWELVGLSSALLIAFFHERPAPVRSGFWTLAVYRTTDLGILGAAVLVHHILHTGNFDAFLGAGWPEGPSPLGGAAATAVGLLVLFAVLGKGAQLPFSGWLPRAMEGPTPSSAIFYGALSIHAGAFLLLRMAPILDQSPIAAAAVVLFGLGTALHATMVGRVQTDIKTALAYASLTQVGIILAEIGLGLRWIPLVHMLGHASVRSLQLLRAPSLLHDFHRLETAVGGHLPKTGAHLERIFPERLRRRLYVASLERWYLDGLLLRVVAPVVGLLRFLDDLEHRWCALIGGRRPSREEGRRD